MTKIFKFTKIGTDEFGTFYATDNGRIREIKYGYLRDTHKLRVEIVVNESGQNVLYTDTQALAILAWANACSYDVFAAYERNGAATTGCEEIAAPAKETA